MLKSAILGKYWGSNKNYFWEEEIPDSITTITNVYYFSEKL